MINKLGSTAQKRLSSQIQSLLVTGRAGIELRQSVLFYFINGVQTRSKKAFRSYDMSYLIWVQNSAIIFI